MTGKQATISETAPSASERVELEGLFTMMLGVWYPRHYVVAAIDPTAGAQAVEALRSAGFDGDSVRLETGARVGQIRRTIHEQRTRVQRAGAALGRTLTDEGLMSQEYFEEAECVTHRRACA